MLNNYPANFFGPSVTELELSIPRTRVIEGFYQPYLTGLNTVGNLLAQLRSPDLQSAPSEPAVTYLTKQQRFGIPQAGLGMAVVDKALEPTEPVFNGPFNYFRPASTAPASSSGTEYERVVVYRPEDPAPDKPASTKGTPNPKVRPGEAKEDSGKATGSIRWNPDEWKESVINFFRKVGNKALEPFDSFYNNFANFVTPDSNTSTSSPETGSNTVVIYRPKDVVVSRAPKDAASVAYNFFTQKGLAPHQAAGIVGNLIQESGNFNPKVISGEIKGDSGKATGVAQWHPDRWKAVSNFIRKNNLDQNSLEGQLEGIWYELNSYEKRALQKLKSTKTADEAANVFNKYYERSADKTSARANYAKEILRRFTLAEGGEVYADDAQIKILKKLGYKVTEL